MEDSSESSTYLRMTSLDDNGECHDIGCSSERATSSGRVRTHNASQLTSPHDHVTSVSAVSSPVRFLDGLICHKSSPHLDSSVDKPSFGTGSGEYQLGGSSSGVAMSTTTSGVAQRFDESLHGRLRLGLGTRGVVDGPPGESHLASIATHNNTSSMYVTRYQIDHEIQTKKLCSEAVFEECAPFCNVEATRTPIGWIWSFISSELFLYSLHLTAIALGAFKAAMDLRNNYPMLELEHSIIETCATLFFILIRMINAGTGYSMIRSTIGCLEHFDPKRDARLRSIRMWMWLFQLVSLLLIVFCVISFVMFYKFVHLGWTLISNQFSLITSIVLSGLYMARVTVSVIKIREDQHKAVVYEAMLLLQEFCLNGENGNNGVTSSRPPTQDTTIDNDDLHAPVRTFVRAISNTGLFKPPSHINLRAAACTRQRDELHKFISNNDKFDNIRRYCEEILDETLI